MKHRITQSAQRHMERNHSDHAQANVINPAWQVPITFALAFTIACILSLLMAHSASAESVPAQPVLESPFIPDDNEFFTGKKGVKGNWLTSKARSLDNTELLQTANNLRINDMSAGQRMHNYYWIQGGSDKLTSGKSASKYLLQSFAKAYWNYLRETEFNGLAIIPDADGAGSIKINRRDIDYKLRVSADRVKLMVKLDF
ncbi:hypothetical protein [Aurantivibrio plasticivorans]